MDGDLKRTIQFLLERNVAVVVHNQHDLNLICSSEENAKASLERKEKASSSDKGKTNATSQVRRERVGRPPSTITIPTTTGDHHKSNPSAPPRSVELRTRPKASNNDVISKAALAQRARRQRERDAKRQMAQSRHQEREESGECLQPIQPRFFPALIPSRRRQLILERAKTKAMKGNAIQSTSLSTEKTENAPQRTVVTKSLVSSSTTISTEKTENAQQRTVVTEALVQSLTTAILSQKPNLVANPINGRSLPLVKNMLSQPKRFNQVDIHSLPPPQNLGSEPGRKINQQGLHFKALGGPSSSTPWNLSSSNNGGNKHLINSGQSFKLELGSGKLQDNMEKYANCNQLRQCPLKPEICPKQTLMQPKYVHFVPVATTNYSAPVMTSTCGGSSVGDSLGKPGISFHAGQSACNKTTAEAPHLIGSKGSCEKQRTFPHSGPSARDSLGKPDSPLHAVQSVCHKSTVKSLYSIGSKESDDKQRTFSHEGPSVHDSLGKPGVDLHAAQSDCHRATAEALHSIGSKESDDKQRTVPHVGPSVHDSLGKPCIDLPAVQSDCHKATAETPHSTGSKDSDGKQRTFPHEGPSVHDSLGKPGTDSHAVQSDCHKATAETPHSIGSNESDKQRIFPHGGLSVRDCLGKPGIDLHAVQSDFHKATVETPHSVGSKRSDDKQRTERFFCLPNLLKQLDESDYKERLLHLPPAKLSRHAFELEKRAVQLTIEEGKETQRVQDLNILGNVVDYLTIVNDSRTVSSPRTEK